MQPPLPGDNRVEAVLSALSGVAVFVVAFCVVGCESSPRIKPLRISTPVMRSHTSCDNTSPDAGRRYGSGVSYSGPTYGGNSSGGSGIVVNGWNRKQRVVPCASTRS